MTTVYRPVLYTLAAAALFGIAAPALACPSDGNRSYSTAPAQDEGQECKKDTGDQGQAQLAQGGDITVLRVQDDAGRLDSAYADADGVIWKLEDGE